MLDLCLIQFWLKIIRNHHVSYCTCKYKCIGYKFLQLNNRLRYNMSIGHNTPVVFIIPLRVYILSYKGKNKQTNKQNKK